MDAVDLVIALGPRSLLALLGAIILIAGVWYVDRTWDEIGAASYTRAKKRGDATEITQEELDAAFPFPWAFILGWSLFAISYLFPTDGAVRLDLRPSSVVAFVLSLALAGIASVPMGDAVRYRKAGKKKKLSMAFVLCWVGLTAASGYSVDIGATTFVLGGVGAVFIIMSMKILWKHRKMGDSWEREGRPNPKPVVYNPGGPLFIFGWFLFWVAMASTTPAVANGGLPIYLNLRTGLAFFAGCGMVPIVLMIDYAHDEGGKYVGFGTDGTHFGRFFESPIPFLTMWTLFGLASFVALNGTIHPPDTRRWLILANCIAQAIVAGGLIQTALYKQQIALKNKFSIVFVLLFLALAVNIGWGGGLSAYLAVPGAMLVIAGQKTVFGDRKRGDYWMVHKEVNPNPVVYSIGEPLFMAGWILLSLAMSQPMT